MLAQKYRSLRNRVTNMIRQDERNLNQERMEKARTEDEVWKIVKEITEPKTEKHWRLTEGDRLITEEQEVADIFDRYFMDKIEKLKLNIEKEYVEEPLERPKTRMANRNLKFSLKTVCEKTVAKAIKSLNKKKSAGRDGLSQENLILGTEVLKIPLTRLINNSIEKGEFPKCWKEAVVTPILKKGSPGCKENYRPVSYLNVASKVLEK